MTVATPARKRMLVVDDEARVLDVLREHFAQRYDIETASSASHAVERFQERRPDVVFLDVNLPGVDGLKLLRFLRQVDAAVPVIIVTANTQTSVAAQVLEAGAFGYVPKPFNLVYMDHLAAAAARVS
jgi:DNA-binding response OmpR family regulator